MKLEALALPGVLLIEPEVFTDARGMTFESWNARTFRAHGIAADFVQETRSRSRRGALRGLHYQVQRPQAKLLSVLRGRIFDVVVDLRRSSAHFGRSVVLELDAGDPRMLWIPPGFAHGFLALADPVEVAYMLTDYRSPEHERAIHWRDPELAIPWPAADAIVVSTRDSSAPRLRDAEVFP